MARCKVGLVPYKLTPYTKGVSPLKTYEYLAAGLAVVSTPIPGVAPDAPHVSVSESHRHFVDLVRGQLDLPAVDRVVAARRSLAEQNSWVGRGQEARALVERLLSETS
ncbi:hypothetical protein StoSoilA2_34200 [Arthrobacter sp. StoSoilA2]|nr:hypothetical protein StoSoilA2_34200 [Arthrobacter sp. StoSoilA2]